MKTEELKDVVESLFVGDPQMPIIDHLRFEHCNDSGSCDPEELSEKGLKKNKIRFAIIWNKELFGEWVDESLVSCCNYFGASLQSLCIHGCRRIKEDNVIEAVEAIENLKVVFNFPNANCEYMNLRKKLLF